MLDGLELKGVKIWDLGKRFGKFLPSNENAEEIAGVNGLSTDFVKTLNYRCYEGDAGIARYAPSTPVKLVLRVNKSQTSCYWLVFKDL